MVQLQRGPWLVFPRGPEIFSGSWAPTSFCLFVDSTFVLLWARPLQRMLPVDPLHVSSSIRTAWRSPWFTWDVCTWDNHLDASLRLVWIVSSKGLFFSAECKESLCNQFSWRLLHLSETNFTLLYYYQSQRDGGEKECCSRTELQDTNPLLSIVRDSSPANLIPLCKVVLQTGRCGQSFT